MCGLFKGEPCWGENGSEGCRGAEGGRWVATLKRDRGEGELGQGSLGKSLPSRGRAKALGQECAWHTWGTARRPRLETAKEEEEEKG